MLRLRERAGVWPNKRRSHLRKVFSSDIGVEASSQVCDILEYACGLILGSALISTENPNFEIASVVRFLAREIGHGSAFHNL